MTKATQEAWKKKHIRVFQFSVSVNQYPDLIDYLDRLENKSEWLKLAALNQMETDLSED